MAVEFQCEKCGELVSIEADAGSTVKCPHCSKRIVVPAALASLPSPQVPEPGAAPPAQPPLGDAGASPLPGEPPAQAPPEGEEGEAEEEEVVTDSALMGSMATIMPWVISVFLHLSLGMILMFVTMFIIIKREAVDVIVADDTLSATPGGVVNPGHGDPDRRPEQNRIQKEATGYAKREAAVASDSGETDEQIELIGPGAGGSSGGSLAPFGLHSGGHGAGPKSNFFGRGGNAHHIVYLIDSSGSMVDTFDYVRMEMVTSIGNLVPQQDFHVILFSDGIKPKENRAKRLVQADDDNKQAAARFLREIHPESTTGQTNPILGLERAFTVLARADKKTKGKLIYLLTDGEFHDNAAVLKAIRARNKNKDVHINTYMYGFRPDEAVRVLKSIASENGGRYKYVSTTE